jgi:hypothetical protein
MKRSTQVLLVVMGVIGTASAGQYLMSLNGCTQPGPDGSVPEGAWSCSRSGGSGGGHGGWGGGGGGGEHTGTGRGGFGGTGHGSGG